MNFHSYLTLFLVSFFANLPLGYIREGSPKFSNRWFIWNTISIPFLIYFSFKWNVGWIFPICMVLAVFGQRLGARSRQRKVTPEMAEAQEWITDLKIPAASNQRIPDEEIMVVLLNMGGPKTIEEVRPFLTRLFLDELILKFPLSFILQPLFAKLIVASRGKEAEKRYALIGGGSPIFKSTADQTAALAREFKNRGRKLDVIFSFNYSDPLPDETIRQIKTAGKKYILSLGLYPHYSLATIGSNIHYLKKEAQKNFPELIFLKSGSYYLADSYIGAFVDRIHETLKRDESLDDFYLLFSAHGLPLYFLMQGDRYAFEISQTVAKVLTRLERQNLWAISYQSAVGSLEWLKPSTEAMIKALAHRGIKKLLVVPISFVTDHIETLCEIDIEYRKVAEDAGIKDFRISKALECHPGFIRALGDCVEESLNQRAVKKEERYSRVER